MSRTDSSGIDNVRRWLTTIVARICLDMLRSRKSRREHSLESSALEVPGTGPVPGDELELADTVGVGLLVVLDALSPPERLAVVLHDMFGIPFDEIAEILQRTPEATRQLASRARRRLRSGPVDETNNSQRQEIVAAFLTASRDGDFRALIALLDPHAQFTADSEAVRLGKLAAARLNGAEAIATVLSGRAVGAQLAMVDGLANLVVAPGGKLLLAINLTIWGGKITAVQVTGSQDTLNLTSIDLMR